MDGKQLRNHAAHGHAHEVGGFDAEGIHDRVGDHIAEAVRDRGLFPPPEGREEVFHLSLLPARKHGRRDLAGLAGCGRLSTVFRIDLTGGVS